MMRPLALLLAASGLVSSCAAEEEEVIDLGPVTDGKADVPEIRDREVTLRKRTASGAPSVKTFSVTSDGDFRVELRYDDAAAQTRIVVIDGDSGARLTSPKGVGPTLEVDVAEAGLYKIKLENYADHELPARLSVLVAGTSTLPEDLVAAARRNLGWVRREIDYFHLDNYGLSGATEDKFLEALRLEYQAVPEQYRARMSALGSMVFFAAPEVRPPASGKETPFHGLDETQFAALIDIEDQVFDQLVGQSGSLVGVRPFSVCETRYLIESYVRPRRAYDGFAAYKAGYQTFAGSCPAKDLDEWYNFRGLGHLRPSWLESNVMDRFLRRMLTRCASPSGVWVAECAAWNADRLGYRTGGNRELATRLLFYAPAQEEVLAEPGSALVLLEDRDGDGVGEMLREGPARLTSGAEVDLVIESTGEFTGQLKARNAAGTVTAVKPQDVVAEEAVHPDFQRALLARPDLGLLSVYADGSACTSATPDPAACPLLKRFFVLIDRHEDFYRTYSALSPDRSSISSQPSPLVACSITLGAAHAWDSAGTPSGGTAGFIFLMRIPFAQILAGSRKTVATLDPGPAVLAIQDLYEGKALDLGKVWLDIASLSNNLFASEHEISKFGAVPAEQIEGILVIRRPAAMP